MSASWLPSELVHFANLRCPEDGKVMFQLRRLEPLDDHPVAWCDEKNIDALQDAFDVDRTDPFASLDEPPGGWCRVPDHVALVLAHKAEFAAEIEENWLAFSAPDSSGPFVAPSRKPGNIRRRLRARLRS
jgi:hypothetical protein